MDKRWGLNIDVEGFSHLYEHSEDGKTAAIFALRDLMDAVVKVGRFAYPGDPTKNESDRIFAHQFGDGFILVSNFKEADAERCISIGVSLMRHMAMLGHATKCAISTGDMSDIKGCYPSAVRASDHGTVVLGAGLLTTIPVMGTALTKAHKLGARVSGNVLVLDLTQFSSYPSDWIYKIDGNIGFVDWRKNELPLPREISEKAGLSFGTEAELLEKFNSYVMREPRPSKKWIISSKIS